MRTGEACLASSSQLIRLKASPVIGFDAPPPVCEEAAPFQLPAKELLGAPGTGLFSGDGTNTAGIFDPAVAGPGNHSIRFVFRGANGCDTAAVQSITVNPTPGVSAGPDKGVLPDGQTILEGSGTAVNVLALSYSWLPRESVSDPRRARPSVFPKEDTRYFLTVTSADGCKATDDVLVKVLPKIVVPNAFTPNGDGINDNWVLLYLESYPNCIVEVFNRYGQRVFHSTGYGRPWDGRMNGSLLPAGTYYWLLNPNNGKETLKGSVTIIR